MDILQQSEILQESHIQNILLAQYFQQLAKVKPLELQYTETIINDISHNPQIPIIETTNVKNAVAAYETLLAIQKNNTFLINEFYLQENIDIKILPIQQENYTLLYQNENIATYLLQYQHHDEGAATFQTVITIDTEYQNIHALAIQIQYDNDKQNILKALIHPIVQDTRIKLREFDIKDLNLYFQYFDPYTQQLKNPEEYEFFSVEKNIKNKSIYEFFEIFEYKDYALLGGSGTYFEWKDQECCTSSLCYPYTYEFIGVIRHKNHRNIIPIAKPNENILITADPDNLYANVIEKEKNKNLHKNLWNTIYLKSIKNIKTATQPKNTITIESWNDVKTLKPENIEFYFCKIENIKKDKQNQYFLPIAYQKFHPQQVEYVRYINGNVLTGRNTLDNVKDSKPALQLADAPISLQIAIKPYDYAYYVQTLFTAFSHNMQYSVFAYLLPDLTLYFGIRNDKKFSAIRSSQKISLLKWNYIAFNIPTFDPNTWSIIINDINVPIQIIEKQNFHFSWNYIYDYFFLATPDFEENTIEAALESGFYAPCAIYFAYFLLEVGIQNTKNAAAIYQQGVTNFFTKNNQQCIAIYFNENNYNHNNLFCKVTGHPAWVQAHSNNTETLLMENENSILQQEQQ
jgi:hypothetical protein